MVRDLFWEDHQWHDRPSTCLTFLGFEFDSRALEMWLPRVKLLELQQTSSAWVGRCSCRKKEFESGGKAILCKQSSRAREDISPSTIWAFERDTQGLSSYSVECLSLIRHLLVVHIHSIMERRLTTQGIWQRRSWPLSYHRCLWPSWLRGPLA